MRVNGGQGLCGGIWRNQLIDSHSSHWMAHRSSH